ncbi:hypothetical protein EVAR_92603_1 [Eumeta japonica]|uniref:Uncharacterized protein n=1 Tax=Eumeta variegata TaxID=151549 RepID=A0A4C1SXE4_EUMVA|nr:hypothetical protein EVAR_92603_1 [Eumeta japonica]
MKESQPCNDDCTRVSKTPYKVAFDSCLIHNLTSSPAPGRVYSPTAVVALGPAVGSDPMPFSALRDRGFAVDYYSGPVLNFGL